jgi:hypothetical protein
MSSATANIEANAFDGLDRIHSNSKATECLIIYDWDDTILPTSWLRSLGYLSNNISDMIGTPPPNLPGHVASMMRLIEDATVDNFRQAMALGRVIIITNSSCLWVPFTAKRFFPKLSQIIEAGGFEVYSARPAQAENAGPNYVYLPSMAVTWKTDKFREMVGSVPYQTCVSIGDGFAERCAVLAIANSRMSGKAVRFPLQPSGAVLLEQLKIMLRNLEDVVMDSRTGDLYLNTSTGSYRIIPVQPTGSAEQPIAIPLTTAKPTTERMHPPVDTEKQSSSNSQQGIMQALASGLVYYGKSIGNRMSLVSGGSGTGTKGSNTPKGERKPIWTVSSSSTTTQPGIQDENRISLTEESSTSIRVEIMNTSSSTRITRL